MIGKTNAGFGGGAGGTLAVSAAPWSTITISKDGKNRVKTAGADGAVTFRGLQGGVWTVTIARGSQTAVKRIAVTTDYSITIAFFSATINITYPAGSTCTATDGETTLIAPDTNGAWACRVPNPGTWTVNAILGSDSDSEIVSITSENQTVSVELAFNVIPEFTYSGSFKIVDDAGNPISTSKKNWQIQFLTSGTLVFSNLNGAQNGIDAFLVGGGGGGAAVGDGGTGTYGNFKWGSGGGGSGYTKTKKAFQPQNNTPYAITIGPGGSVGNNGGATSAFDVSAAGGQRGYTHDGGAGGSGGASGTWSDGGSGGQTGGKDGSRGAGYNNATYGQTASGGSGQGATTRAFGDSSGKVYADGGAGGGGYNTTSGGNATQGPQGSNGGGGHGRPNGIANTGSGGAGGGYRDAGGTAGAGGSGIVIIRNARQ